MLTKKDKVELREMFVEILTGALHNMKRDIREETCALILASESRMMQRLEKLRHDIVNDIGSILDEAVLPQIAELQHEVRRIKLHVHMV